MKRLDQLTFTRFLAVFLVLVYHDTAVFYIQPLYFFPITPLLYAAPTAVSYLYVLSGFVMSLVYHRPQEKFNIRGYWSARFVRIYPLYIISFLVVCLYYLEFMPHIKAPKILANIFVVQAWWPNYAQSFNYSSWSLVVEFFFYALFPFFTIWAYKQPMRRLVWVSIGLWAITQITYYFLWMFYFPDWEYFLVYFPPFHLNSFILGVVAGIWLLREAPKFEIKPKLNLTLLVGVVIFVVLFTIAGAIFPQVPHDLQPMSGLLSPLFAVFILTLALDKTRLSRFLNHPWLVMLGEMAFVLYVLEVPFAWFFRRFLSSASLADPEFVFKVSALPLILIIGYVAHLYVDRPLRRMLKQVMDRISMPMLLMDLGFVALSIYLSFLIRFGTGKDLKEFTPTAYRMFWLAFIIRMILPVVFKTVNPTVLLQSFAQVLRRILLSVTVGSLILAALLWLSFIMHLIPGVPRSVFVLDWVLIMWLSLLSRVVFRWFNSPRKIEKPGESPLETTQTP